MELSTSLTTIGCHLLRVIHGNLLRVIHCSYQLSAAINYARSANVGRRPNDHK